MARTHKKQRCDVIDSVDPFVNIPDYDGPDIFRCSESRVFQRKELLSESYIPPRLIARDQQITQVAKCLAPGLVGEKPKNILIFGKIGTGKTVVVKHVVKEYIKRREAIEKGAVKAVYIKPPARSNRWTITGAVMNILHQLNLPFRLGRSADIYYHQVLRYLNESSTSLVLIIDEIDKLDNGDMGLIYNISRANSSGDLADGCYITLMGITNNAEFEETLDERALSTLQAECVTFCPYTNPEMVSILNDRRDAFNVGALREGVIPLCAALCGWDHGNAREAIRTLMEAGEIAVSENRSVVFESDVHQAIKKIQKSVGRDVILNLALHERFVLMAIAYECKLAPKGVANISDVIKRYQKIRLANGMEPVHSSRVSQIIRELKVAHIIKIRDYTFGQPGRNRAVSTTLPAEGVVQMLMEDPGISHYFLEVGSPTNN